MLLARIWIIVFLTVLTVFPLIAEAEKAPQRIVSLAPNLTEILFSIGLEDQVVGVTSFCDHPPAAKKKKKIGGMSNPSLEAVVKLKPDLVVLTTDGNPETFDSRLRSLGIRTYIFRARRISELPQGIRDLGRVVRAHDKAEILARSIENTIETVRSRTSHLKSFTKKVLFIVWPEPLIAAGAGTVIDDAITLLGGENMAARAKTAYPKFSLEEILRQSPDLILIGKGEGMAKVSEGFLRRIASAEAVRKGNIFYLSDALYRLGPRLPEGIEELGRYVRE